MLHYRNKFGKRLGSERDGKITRVKLKSWLHSLWKTPLLRLDEEDSEGCAEAALDFEEVIAEGLLIVVV